MSGFLLFCTVFLSLFYALTEKTNCAYYLIYQKEEEITSVGAFDCCFNGGAGYILKAKGKEFLILSGYSLSDNALTVNRRLREAGEDTGVIKVGFSRIPKWKKNRHSLLKECIEILYQTANRIDSGMMNGEQTQSILSNVSRVLNTELLPLREDAKSTLSGDVRYLQIALTEEVLKMGIVTNLEFL